jgi:20S proteasome subunit beta 6
LLLLPFCHSPLNQHSRAARCHAAARRYDDNGGTVVAVAGDTYCVVAASTRMSTGYSILTRNKSKILQL